MGFDIKKLITNVERALNADNAGSAKVDGEFSTEEKKNLSIFGKNAKTIVENAVNNKAEFTAEQAKAIFGLELSGTAPTAAHAARRAGVGDGGDGGSGDNGNTSTNPIIINLPGQNINVDIAVTVNINIKADGSIDVNQLFEDLKNYIKQVVHDENADQSEYIIAFIKGLFEQISGQLDVDLSTVMQAIQDLSTKLDASVEMIKNMYANLLEVMGDNFSFIIDSLKDQGQDIKNIKELLNQLLELAKNIKLDQDNYHSEEMTAISEVYSLVQEISQDLTNLSETQQRQFEVLVEMIKANQIGIEEAVSLLKLIKADVEQNNAYSLQIIELVKNGNEQVLNLVTTYGDTIIEMLKNINPNPVDLSDITKKLNEIMELLKTIDATTKDTNKDTKEIKEQTTEILELVKKFPEYVDTITQLVTTYGDKIYNKLGVIEEFLIKMEKQDREDHKVVVAKLDLLISMVEKLPDGTDIQAILDAISNLSAQNAQETADILAAIADIKTMIQTLIDKGIEVDLSEVITAIADLSAQNATEFNALKTLIENLNPVGPGIDYTDILEEILTAIIDLSSQVSTVENKISTSIEAVITAINNLSIDVGDNISALNDRFDEILEAIKNHHVEVTIKSVPAEQGQFQWTYVDCLDSDEDNQTQAGNAAGAPRRARAVTSEQAREYEILLNFGKPESELSAEEKQKYETAQAARRSVTGITTPKADRYEKDAVYDLQGRKVAANGDMSGLPNGVYIVNGKKFVHRN